MAGICYEVLSPVNLEDLHADLLRSLYPEIASYADGGDVLPPLRAKHVL